MRSRHRRNRVPSLRVALLVLTLFGLSIPGCEPPPAQDDGGTSLTDEQVVNLVERSYPYVTMYNVNNKFAMAQGGWNTCVADTQLKDHTLTDIARPNNDTFYVTCMLDLRNDWVVMEMPAFDSKYASLMITGYDHYVNIPMASRLGDFQEPTRLLIFTARSQGYDAEPLEGVDRMFEATGDFVSAVIRVMPHASEPERMARIAEQGQSVRAVTLSEFLGGEPTPAGDADFPSVGETDLDVFENNLTEVIQFAFDHTTFDPENDMDQAVLAAWEPLGVIPGMGYDPDRIASIDGSRFRETADRVRLDWLSRLSDPAVFDALRRRIFQPKGQTDLEAVLVVSITGPIGIPQEEAVYPQVATSDGQPMTAMHDYVIRMTEDELPPHGAFWSLTLYDLENGFFLPNDRKKYSVGENGGMVLNEDGGIEIWIAAEQPEGVPEENWLPIERQDLDLSPQLRIYVPDLEALETWEAPVAERVER
jgi:hypothetical protein